MLAQLNERISIWLTSSDLPCTDRLTAFGNSLTNLIDALIMQLSDLTQPFG